MQVQEAVLREQNALIRVQFEELTQHIGWNANWLREIAFETLSNTLADAQSLAKVDRPADRQAEVEVETLGDTVAELKAKKPLDTLGDRQAVKTTR